MIYMKASPHHLDSQIGQNIKKNRLKNGVTTKALATLLDVSFQQIQKYEKGQNRIPSSSLFIISKFLGVPVGIFFEDLNEQPNEMKENLEDFKHIKNVSDHEITNLVNNYTKIQDQEIRKKILSLTVTLQSTQES